MNEDMKEYYQNEEEFLDEFSDFDREAANLLKDEWQPNYGCSDKVRKNRDYFLSTRGGTAKNGVRSCNITSQKSKTNNCGQQKVILQDLTPFVP